MSVAFHSTKISSEPIKLSQAGIENMKFQRRALEKYQAGEELDEAEQKVIDRIQENQVKAEEARQHANEAKDSKLANLGLGVKVDLSNLQEMPGKLEEIDNLMLHNYRQGLEQKTGYGAVFDEISRDYAEKLMNHKYEEASNKDVLARMESQYQAFSEEIEKNYTGEAKTEKLNQLHADYKKVLEDNIIKPMDMMLANERTIYNILRQSVELNLKTAKARKQDTKPYEEKLSLLNQNADGIYRTQEQMKQLKGIFAALNKDGLNAELTGSLFQDITKNLAEIHAMNHVEE